MSELAGRDITKAMLDSWTAEFQEMHRLPAVYLSAFCEAVGSHFHHMQIQIRVGRLRRLAPFAKFNINPFR